MPADGVVNQTAMLQMAALTRRAMMRKMNRYVRRIACVLCIVKAYAGIRGSCILPMCVMAPICSQERSRLVRAQRVHHQQS